MDNKSLSICIGADDGHKYEKLAKALDQEIKKILLLLIKSEISRGTIG